MAADNENATDKTMIMTPADLSRGRVPAPRSRLVCRNPQVLGSPAGQEILLDGAEISIGRSPEHDVRPKADGISRNHAKVFPADGTWGIEDLGSTNGVIVNGTKAHQTWLKHGDVVVLGTVEYTFEQLREAAKDEEPDVMVEAEKTVVMRPSVKAQAAAPSAAASHAEHAPSARPAASRSRRTTGSGARRAAREKPAAGSGLMLLIVLALAVAVVVGLVLLG